MTSQISYIWEKNEIDFNGISDKLKKIVKGLCSLDDLMIKYSLIIKTPPNCRELPTVRLLEDLLKFLQFNFTFKDFVLYGYSKALKKAQTLDMAQTYDT